MYVCTLNLKPVLLKFHIPVPTFGGYLAEPLIKSPKDLEHEKKADEGEEGEEGDETNRILEAEVMKTGTMIGPITAMHVQVCVTSYEKGPHTGYAAMHVMNGDTSRSF